MKDDLLPSALELRKLSDQQEMAVFELVDRANRREHSYDLAALLCGTVSFLGVVAGFIYLVPLGIFRPARVLLGVAMLAVVGQMMGLRLRS